MKAEEIIRVFKSMSESKAIKWLMTQFPDGSLPGKVYTIISGEIRHSGFNRIYRDFFSPYTNERERIIANREKEERKNQKQYRDTRKASKASSSSKKSIVNGSGNLITVKAFSFKFLHTFTKPRLVYKGRERFFMGRSEWFKPEILRSIQREFTIKYRGADSFVFEPFQDQEVFRTLLEDAYSKYRNTHKIKVIKECDRIVREFLNEKITVYLKQFRHFSIEKLLSEFRYYKEREYYFIQIDCLKALGIKEGSQYRLSVPFSSIIKLFDYSTLTEFEQDIEDKWKDGCSTVLEVNDIFPGIQSKIAGIKIPAIYIERNASAESIELVIDYNVGRRGFTGRLANRYSSRYLTDNANVIFNEKTKEALRDVIRQISSPFIETFYSAYVYMFQEGDILIRHKRDEIMGTTGDGGIWSSAEFRRYNSGYYPLLKYDADNDNDWLWLSNQIKKGSVEEAYCFRDMDETHSSKIGATKKYSVKIYLTVQNTGIRLRGGNWVNGSSKFIISLYALDTDKSIYRFRVESTKIYEAIFFLWSYFSSNNYNKRQDFESILVHKNAFGISYFYKDPPLCYKTGIGYCDSEWDKEFY